jgi:pectinesterase
VRIKDGYGVYARVLLLSCILLVAIMSDPVAGIEAVVRPAGFVEDIEYGRAGGQRLLLDAFVPNGNDLRPVVILIHGGGWSSGTKKDMEFLFGPLSEANFAWFSISYRLAPEHRWPACMDDVRTAIRWVKANGSAYKADFKRIALVGYSAGGHLACLAAVLADETDRVQAVVGLAPPTDHEADSQRRGGLSPSIQKLLDRPQEIDDQTQLILQHISPIQYVNAGLPPFLLVHGTEDISVPYSQTIAFMDKLTHYAAPCKLLTIEGAGHRVTEWESLRPGLWDEVISWLKAALQADRFALPEASVFQKPTEKKVASNGSAEYSTVQAAIDAIPEGNTTPIIIAIEPGIYKEKIVVPRYKPFINFRGRDAKQTILTFDLYAGMKDETGKEIGTFRTPSVTIGADDFAAENITFENSAGPVGQAVAIAVFGDRVTFRNCRFLGWQDTVLDHFGRHYYEECTIVGHCDFIFGGGTAIFERCRIHCLKSSYITAASTPQHEPYGFVFSNCTITGKEGVKSYLGRPWRDYANVLFLNTQMAGLVREAGWHNWDKPEREKTARYGEYNSTGPGAAAAARVAWSRQLTKEEAAGITIKSVLGGQDGWDPSIQKEFSKTETPQGTSAR